MPACPASAAGRACANLFAGPSSLQAPDRSDHCRRAGLDREQRRGRFPGAAGELLIFRAAVLVFDRIQEHGIEPWHLFVTDMVKIHRIRVALKKQAYANDHDGE
jgi:hypothetical protein